MRPSSEKGDPSNAIAGPAIGGSFLRATDDVGTPCGNGEWLDSARHDLHLSAVRAGETKANLLWNALRVPRHDAALRRSGAWFREVRVEADHGGPIGLTSIA
jgi:hypothetical protein